MATGRSATTKHTGQNDAMRGKRQKVESLICYKIWVLACIFVAFSMLPQCTIFCSDITERVFDTTSRAKFSQYLETLADRSPHPPKSFHDKIIQDRFLCPHGLPSSCSSCLELLCAMVTLPACVNSLFRKITAITKLRNRGLPRFPTPTGSPNRPPLIHGCSNNSAAVYLSAGSTRSMHWTKSFALGETLAQSGPE